MSFAHNGKKSKGRSVTVFIVRVAVLAAMLTVGKLALSFIPNVEIVTLLVIVYGSALGPAYVLPATLIFCAVEMALYGIGTWNVLYFVYWPLLGLCSCLLRGRRLPLAILLGAVGSVAFGALDACVNTLFVAGKLAPISLGNYFVVYYLRGLYFDLIHVISSAVTIGFLYLPLVKVLSAAMRDAYLKRRLRSSAAAYPYVYKREAKLSARDICEGSSQDESNRDERVQEESVG